MTSDNEQLQNIEELIEDKVLEVWHEVVSVCTKTLHIADFYGFDLASIPDPDIPAMVKLLHKVVLPYIEILIYRTNLSNSSNSKVINMKQYLLYLRKIAIALEDGNKVEFDSAVDSLRSEPML